MVPCSGLGGVMYCVRVVTPLVFSIFLRLPVPVVVCTTEFLGAGVAGGLVVGVAGLLTVGGTCVMTVGVAGGCVLIVAGLLFGV